MWRAIVAVYSLGWIRFQNRLMAQYEAGTASEQHHQEKFELASAQLSHTMKKLRERGRLLGGVAGAKLLQDADRHESQLFFVIGFHMGWQFARRIFRKKHFTPSSAAFVKCAPEFALWFRHGGLVLGTYAVLFDILSAFLPRRLADEELGDALEDMRDRLAQGGSRVWVACKGFSAIVWTLLHVFREVCASLLGRKAS